MNLTFQVISHTQDEDHLESGTLNLDSEPLAPNADEPTNLQEEQRQEDQRQETITVTPSTTRSKATSNTKRLAQLPPQPLPKRKRKVQDPLDEALNKLQTISDECKEAEEDEFDLFCKSLACQLKKMPLERALLCQEKLQSVMTQERLHQITYTSAPHSNCSGYSAASSYPNSPTSPLYIRSAPPEQNTNSTVYSAAASYPTSPPLQEYTQSQDIISQAFSEL